MISNVGILSIKILDLHSGTKIKADLFIETKFRIFVVYY